MIDETSFQVIFEATRKPLRAYVFRLVQDDWLADDLVQESYVRLLGSRVPQMNEAQMKAYLFRIATNLIRDRWRRRKEERIWLEEQMAETAAGTPVEDIWLKSAVAGAFEKLSPQQRSLMWLAYVEGYDHREIARTLDLKEKSVRVLLFRARGKLTGLLKKMGMMAEQPG